MLSPVLWRLPALSIIMWVQSWGCGERGSSGGPPKDMVQVRGLPPPQQQKTKRNPPPITKSRYQVKTWQLNISLNWFFREYNETQEWHTISDADGTKWGNYIFKKGWRVIHVTKPIKSPSRTSIFFFTYGIYKTMEIKRFTSIILGSEKTTQFLGSSWLFSS